MVNKSCLFAVLLFVGSVAGQDFELGDVWADSNDVLIDRFMEFYYDILFCDEDEVAEIVSEYFVDDAEFCTYLTDDCDLYHTIWFLREAISDSDGNLAFKVHNTYSGESVVGFEWSEGLYCEGHGEATTRQVRTFLIVDRESEMFMLAYMMEDRTWFEAVTSCGGHSHLALPPSLDEDHLADIAVDFFEGFNDDLFRVSDYMSRDSEFCSMLDCKSPQETDSDMELVPYLFAAHHHTVQDDFIIANNKVSGSAVGTMVAHNGYMFVYRMVFSIEVDPRTMEITHVGELYDEVELAIHLINSLDMGDFEEKTPAYQKAVSIVGETTLLSAAASQHNKAANATNVTNVVICGALYLAIAGAVVLALRRR